MPLYSGWFSCCTTISTHCTYFYHWLWIIYANMANPMLPSIGLLIQVKCLIPIGGKFFILFFVVLEKWNLHSIKWLMELNYRSGSKAGDFQLKDDLIDNALTFCSFPDFNINVHRYKFKAWAKNEIFRIFEIILGFLVSLLKLVSNFN